MDSLSKNKIKWVNSLRLKKNRLSEGVFVVEGHKIVSEILSNYPDLIELIATTQIDKYHSERTFQVDEKDIKKLSQLKTPPSVVAVVKRPEFKAQSTNFILAIDGVQDPGNMGTIIRTADWFGIEKIYCSKDTVDAYNSKVVQASMGSIFRMEIKYTDLTVELPKFNKPIYGASLDGANLYESQLEQSAILVVGNEGSGISAEVQSIIHQSILIPRKGKAESLNVAIATGILLSELSRLS